MAILTDQELTSVQEDYIETILHLIREKKVARNKDIAVRMGVATPTVTGAMQMLANKGLINYESHGFVTLTEEGEKLAETVVEKHELFTYFFKDILGIDAEKADDVACKIEHIVLGQAFDRFRDLIENIKNCGSSEKFSCVAGKKKN